MNRFILDTNAFNNILDGEDIDVQSLSGLAIYATHIQWDELSATKDVPRRTALLDVFIKLNPEEMPTEGFVLDISRLGKAKLGDKDVYMRILTKLNSKEQRDNNIQDTLIGITAFKNNLILVTDDGNFSDVMKEMGCSVITLDELLKSS